jgi:hypothetical protein
MTTRTWIRKLFAPQPAPTTTCRSNSARRAVKSRPRKVLLQVEALEQRTVPAVTYHGGALLPSVEAQALYLGDNWVNDPNLNHTAHLTLDPFLSDIVNSPYMDALTTAGYNVGRGSASPGAFDPQTLDSSTFLAISTIPTIIQHDINNRLLQEPDANRLYCVYVEPNVAVGNSNFSSINAFLGYHSTFPGNDSSGTPIIIRYAVMAWGGGSTVGGWGNITDPWLSPVQQDTLVSSHELAEAVTDPDIGRGIGGWFDDKVGEVADIVAHSTYYLDGYAVQRISDRKEQAMTSAKGTANLDATFFLNANGTWGVDYGGSPVAINSPKAGVGVAKLTDQSIDFEGRAVVDIVLANGDAWEYHLGGAGIGPDFTTNPFVPIGTKISQAVAAQGGSSYLLGTNGQVTEIYSDHAIGGAYDNHNHFHPDGFVRDVNTAGRVTRISAGTDVFGVSAVGFLRSNGNLLQDSDSTGVYANLLGMTDISMGRQGISVALDTSNNASLLTELTSGSVQVQFLAANVLQATAGTDAFGNYQYDLVFTDHTAVEFSSTSQQTTSLGSNISSVSKARLGETGVLFTDGTAFVHTSAGNGDELGTNVIAVG